MIRRILEGHMAAKKKKYIMFIDETGDGVNTPFTITGAIFEYKYCIDQDGKSVLREKLNKFKEECFGTQDIIDRKSTRLNSSHQ